jgi:hypothetical protein
MANEYFYASNSSRVSSAEKTVKTQSLVVHIDTIHDKQMDRYDMNVKKHVSRRLRCTQSQSTHKIIIEKACVSQWMTDCSNLSSKV